MRIYGQKPLFGAFVRKTEIEASKIWLCPYNGVN